MSLLESFWQSFPVVRESTENATSARKSVEEYCIIVVVLADADADADADAYADADAAGDVYMIRFGLVCTQQFLFAGIYTMRIRFGFELLLISLCITREGT